jgi:hypothetical protein
MPGVVGFFDTVGRSNLPFIEDYSQFPGSGKVIDQLDNYHGCANCLHVVLAACTHLPEGERREQCDLIKSSIFTSLDAHQSCAKKGKVHGVDFDDVPAQCQRICSPESSVGYGEGYESPYRDPQGARTLGAPK